MTKKKYRASAIPISGGNRVTGYLFKPNAPNFDHNFGTWIIDESVFDFRTWLSGGRASVTLQLTEIVPDTILWEDEK